MSSRKPLSKAEKSLFLVCTLALIPLAAVVFVASGRNAEPNWIIAPAAPRPKPDGYDFYVAAAKATVRFKPEVDAASDVHIPSGSDPLTSPYVLKNYSLARRQQWLKANARTFVLLNQGLTTLSMAPDTTSVMNRDWSELRQLARDIGARSRTFQMAHQPMRATMSSLDGMQMAQDTTRGGALLARLVGMAISRSPRDDFDRTINQLNASEAKTATKRLDSMLSHQFPLKDALKVEKHDSLLLLKQMLDSPDWRGGWQSRFNNGNSFFDEGFHEKVERQTISKTTVWNNVNRALDDRIQNADAPYSKIRNIPKPSDLDVFSSDFYLAPNIFLRNEARNATSNNMLLLRLALRAYIAEHKTAPPTLAALSPGLLKSIPTDIYNDGKPLFYKPNGATYKLWSVGPDGVNDGGVPFTDKQGKNPKHPASNLMEASGKGDFVAGLCR